MYLINIASAPFNLLNLKQPIYYKLRSKIITNYGSFIAHNDNCSYKSSYSKITANYDKNLLQITTVLSKIMAVDYYKLRQFYYKLRQKIILNYNIKILQITAALTFAKLKIITNYVKFHCKWRQLLLLLQIIVNFVTNYGRHYKLWRCYKLRRNKSLIILI